jgi:acyl carrier protein
MDARQLIHLRVEDLFRTVFAVPDLVVMPQTDAASIPEWDSFSHIILMVAIEQEFGVRFRGNELAEFQNVGALEDFLVENATLHDG